MLLIRPPWIKGRESLSQLPEPRLLADAFLDEEPLDGFTAVGGEQDRATASPACPRGVLRLDARLVTWPWSLFFRLRQDFTVYRI